MTVTNFITEIRENQATVSLRPGLFDELDEMGMSGRDRRPAMCGVTNDRTIKASGRWRVTALG
jgi:hypothetical protein